MAYTLSGAPAGDADPTSFLSPAKMTLVCPHAVLTGVVGARMPWSRGPEQVVALTGWAGVSGAIALGTGLNLVAGHGTDLAVSGVLAGLAAVLALALRQGRPDQLRGAGPSGDTGTAASGPAS
ncbi:hypothetical protein ACQPYK_13580 [Streptosporangium sp. CA-135522]|uniref:hypothetical protein n=1 Tax=Streptosporangium sp. CA-135522 TaxID=3240072 RepID=UPI003D92AC87